MTPRKRAHPRLVLDLGHALAVLVEHAHDGLVARLRRQVERGVARCVGCVDAAERKVPRQQQLLQALQVAVARRKLAAVALPTQHGQVDGRVAQLRADTVRRSCAVPLEQRAVAHAPRRGTARPRAPGAAAPLQRGRWLPRSAAPCSAAEAAD